MNINISDKKLYNNVYLKSIFSSPRYNVLYGSRDSGKSFAIAQKVVYHMLNDSYCKVVLIRKFANCIKESQYQTILGVIKTWGLEDLFSWTTSPLEIKCKNNGNRIICRGLDDAEKLKSLQDPTLIWVEEATEISYEDFIKVDTSIRCSDPNVKLQLIISFNPDLEEHWINREFFPPKGSYEDADGDFHEVESIKEGAKILHTTYKDNKWCPKERASIYENLNDTWNLVYAKGLWGGTKKGIIFDNIEYAAEMPGIENRKKCGFGLDFGFTNDPSTVIECCLGPGGKIYVEELTYKTGLVNINASNTRSIEQELIDNEVPRNWDIICDSAEPKSIKDLSNAGYSVIGVKKGPGSIIRGIDIMKRYTIVVCGVSKNLKDEFRMISWKLDKAGNATNVPAPGWDHCIDAIRYWCMHFLGEQHTVRTGRVMGMV